MRSLLRGVERALVRVERMLVKVELGVAALAFVAMLGLSLADIVGRNLFHATLPDGDLLLREGVLWVALPGALMAVAARRHLALDPANLAARAGWRRWTTLPFNGLAAVVCALLAHAAWTWWQDEFQTAGSAWQAWSGALLPVAFGLMALHFVLRALLPPEPST